MLYVHTTQQLKCRCRRQNNSIVFGFPTFVPAICVYLYGRQKKFEKIKIVHDIHYYSIQEHSMVTVVKSQSLVEKCCKM